MALKDDMAADLAELELEMAPDGANPETFNWNGGEYPCVRGSVTRGKTLGSAGFALDADLVLFVRAELFPDPNTHDDRPEPKELISFDDTSYLIDDVVTPAAGEPFLKLICQNPNKR